MSTNEPIAIIGSGCRFPGQSSSPSKLWDLLSQPRDTLKEIPSSRFDARGFYNADGNTNGHSNVLHSYVLDEDIRAWDADFFSVSANEAVAIDPQQRLLMETVYEALEAGGQRIRDLRDSDTAVYVGLMGEEYSAIQGRELNNLPTYMATGVARSIVANRISYFFGWHGPSMTIDTACSSSLVAVHQAVQVLRSGNSRVAIAAGTNLLLSMEPYITESTFHMLSPRGRSHMWDADADGYGRGDGVATVVLKRLSDAIADGDVIECVIRETGVNQDGRTNGITVPSADAQVALIQDTYRRAGLDLDSPEGRPQFFEAHGTGTQTGDPLEAEAIHRAIGQRLDHDKLYVGSIKTIIGHTEGTAGIAGLLKTSLALKHGIIPPNMLFHKLNPSVEPFYQGLQVPTTAIPWPTGYPRRASVNSFGFGGTNAHAIVEAYEKPTLTTSPSTNAASTSYLTPYMFSAATKASLRRSLQDTLTFLESSPSVTASDLAYTLNVRRSVFPLRASYAARSVPQLREQLRESLDLPEWETSAVTRPSTAPLEILGVFTGQGAQWAGMGRQLFEDFPFAKARIQELETGLATLPVADRPSWSLLAELQADASKSRLHMAEFAQPLCTALQIVLVDLLTAANVRFHAVVGHSSGEIGAAYAAGVLSARDAMLVAYYRGRHTNLARGPAGQKGTMLAVGTTPEDAREMIELPQFEGRLCLAACNSPTSVTLSGDADAIEEVQAAFEDEGKFARSLRVDKAYHSHHMQPCTLPYVEALRRAGVEATNPRKGCRWYSSVVEGAVNKEDSSAEDLNSGYWARNMAQTVLFSSALENATANHSFTMAVEVGPHGTLKGPAQDTMAAVDRPIAAYISCLARNTDSGETFSKALGQIWANAPEGAVDYDRFHITVHGPSGPQRTLLTALPQYPWDNQRTFWHESRRSRALRLRSEPGHPLLGTITPESSDTHLQWHHVLRVFELPWLSGHQLQGQTVFPAAGYVAMAVEAARTLARRAAHSVHIIELEDLTIGRAIPFESEKTGVEVAFSLDINSIDSRGEEQFVTARFEVRSSSGSATDTVLNASGRLRVSMSIDEVNNSQELLPHRDTEPSRAVTVSKDDFYEELKKLGYNYSGRFRALGEMRRSMGFGRGQITKGALADLHPSEKTLLVHPGYLDAAFQATFLAYAWPGDHQLWSLHVPVSIQRIRINALQWQTHAGSSLDFDAAITGQGLVDDQPGIVADIDIFPDNGSHAMAQIEGVRVIPFAAGTEEQDVPLFYVNAWGPATPDAELAVEKCFSSTEDITLTSLLERLANFYLRRLSEQITSDDEEQAAWHHQQLVAYARHASQQSAVNPKWKHDTLETLQPLVEKYQDTIDVRLLRRAGENLIAAIRGQADIVGDLQQDDLLAQWYLKSLGLERSTQYLSETVGHITHINPHLRVLHIGAGSGGMARSVLHRIEGAFQQYTLTDPSADAVEKAKVLLADQGATSARTQFQPFDISEDALEQEFADHSFQLVIGTLALQSTPDVSSALRNIRRLLQPGGYAVLLESTATHPHRLAVTLGGLEPYWRGSENGRPRIVSVADWHALLSQTGFTGVDTSTPEGDAMADPYTVLVSRATDEHINRLLEPSLVPSLVEGLMIVIVTGRSLESIRLGQAAARLLQPFCESIMTVQSLESLVSAKLTSGVTVLYLGDLDKPAFEYLSPERYAGLQALYANGRNILWITRGARRDRPHAKMSLGLARALMVEQVYSRLNVKVIDLGAGVRADVHMVVDELLRLHLRANPPKEQPELLWTDEPEVEVDTDGRVWAARVVPHRGFNDGYNSTRRSIMSQARPSLEAVEIHHNGHKRSLLRVLAPEARRTDDAEFVKVHVLYTAALPLSVSSTNTWYACVGREHQTGRLVLTVASSIASIVEVSPQWTIALAHTPGKAPARLRAITANVIGALICGEASLNAGLLLVEPDETTASIVSRKCGQNGVSITCVTSSPRKRSSPFVYIHPYASVREIRKALPSSLSTAIFCSAPEQPNDGLLNRLVTALPEGTRLEHAESLARNLSCQTLVDMLRDAVQSDPQESADTSIVSVEEYIGHQQPKTAIVDWRRQESVPLAIQPTDTLPLLRGDRTYLLIGLAGSGGLGLSLAQYLAGLGARHLILTSRKPNVDTKLVADYADRGVKIEFKANDVTDRFALESLVDEVRASWPPIAGVANGAMVLNDVGFENMTYEQMTRVLRPKVEGSRYLDEIFHDDPLDFFVMLSSVSCVHGRSGQANYDAANMYMVGLAAQRRSRGVAASVIDLGAIVGTGVIARDVSHHVVNNLVASGYRTMSERDFLVSFANAILVGRAQSHESEELITGMTLNPRGGRFQPVWHANARFAHLMPNTNQAAQSAGSAGPKESTEELLKRSKSPGDIRRVVQAAVIDKLATMLHLSQEATSDPASLLQQSTSALGVDSLSAVEIRRWMQGELLVDIPVLQILADASVQAMVDFAVDHLPESMTPGLDPNGEDAITAEALTKPNVDTPAPTSAPMGTSTSVDPTSAHPTVAVTVDQPNPSPGGPIVVEDDNTSTSSDSKSQLTPSRSSNTSSVGVSQHSGPTSPSMDKVMPMSFGQARFWVMQQIVEDPCAFNISCDIEINATVDIPRFLKAFESLGDRHEALRTCFFNEDNHQPMQGIIKDSSVRLETVRADPSEVDRYFDEIHRTVFNPSKGELLRAILVTSSPSHHHLLVGYHHINMDSTSFVVLMSDLVRLYAGQKLSPPRLQYADFALHQLERLRNGHWDAHLAYWRREYAQLPDPLPILNVSAKTTRPRPNLITYANIDVETRVPARTARQIQSVCRSVQVTPFHLYTTVLQVLLARLAATTDICIGMADANRAEMGATDSVGNFLNLLPVRSEIELNRPFAELLRSTKRQVLAALSHSPVPFDVILEQIGVQRSATHSPLFQAFIDYRHVTEKLPFGNGHLEGKRYRVSKTPYDIMLEMIDTPTGEASLKILVQQGLYTKAEAEMILSCYMSLLDEFTRDYNQLAKSPTMYETNQVQDALRLGQGELLELKNASFLTQMDAITAVQPTTIALEDSDGNALRWSEMKSKTVALGDRLAQLSLPAHSRIGVFQEPTVNWICSMLGIWRAQHTYVPLETSQGLARLTAVAKEAQLAALVVDDSTVSRVAQLGLGSETAVLNVSGLSWTLSLTAPPSTLGPEDEAMVIYTSGSTGVPKGISIPHRVIVNSLASLLHRWPMSPQTVLQQTALSFDVSWWGALMGLGTKGRVVVAGRNARGDPRALTDLIISKNVTLTFAVPSESVAWLDHANAAALRESSWTYHFSGGEPYSRSLIEHLQALNKPSLRAINIYGPTETMIPNAHEVLYRTISASDLPIPIGRVMPNYTVRVVDEQGHPVPAGLSGHLVYGGPGIAHGYTNNAALTAERFPTDDQAPAAFAERGWTQLHLSGDRGYLRAEDGVFMLQARINGDTQVKLRGLRIDLMDIEAHLLTSAEGRLRDAVVHVRKPSESDTSSEFLVAHVVWGPAGEQHGGFLTKLVRQLQVPDYMRPAIVVAVDALPLTQHGKIDRRAVARLTLPEVADDSGYDSGHGLSGVAGSSRLQKMQELWLNVLGEAVRSHVLHPDSDFFLVGGNSLLLIRMQSELKKHFGREVPLVELFQRNTLAQMAALVDDNTDSHAPPTAIDWEKEIGLQPEVTHLRATAMPLPVTGLVVALTGASGFLGRHLLDHLLNRQDIQTVHAVAVRNPTSLSHVSSPKLVVHRGDLSQPSMGLSDMAAQQIFSTAHAIIHNGADVSFLKAYSTVRPANLTSTKDIVRLALQYGQVRQVHYVSTAGIATMRTSDLYETSLGSLPPPSSPEGYILSKWASELYLERASAASGLRVTIHRPTAIVGDGAPHLDVMSNILHYSKRLHHVPAMSALEGSFQFTGVDDVARDVSRAIGNPPAAPGLSSFVQYRNHNGAPEDTIDVHSLGEYLTRKLGVAVTALPDREWIGQAELAGMPSEVVRYMQGVNLADRQGQRWVFPRALKGPGFPGA